MTDFNTQNKSGWVKVAFGDVVKLVRERSNNPELDGFNRVVGLEHLDPGELKIIRWADIADGTTFTNVFRPGQVLFGKRRAYQRKVALASFEGVCSGDIYVLESSSPQLMPELLPYICQSDAFFDHAVGTSAGSLSPRTNWTSLANFEFMLPPLQEQARIVEGLQRVESLDSKLKRAFNAAENVWRAIANAEFMDDRPHKNSIFDCVTINSGLVDPKLDEFRQQILIGPEHVEKASGILLDKKTVSEQGAISGKFRFTPRSVVYSKIRPELRKVFLADFNGLCSADMYPLLCKDNIIPEYLLDLLLSDRFTAYAVSCAKRTGMPKLNKEQLGGFKFDPPSLHNQRAYTELAKNIKTAMAEIKRRSRQLETTKQRMLMNAFEI
ncbi:restriction endonuclease subunit S [bacterium]|nr:restriction endonuclease subunit S [bacterium]